MMFDSVGLSFRSRSDFLYSGILKDLVHLYGPEPGILAEQDGAMT
ncbi:hypothetical protein M6B38_398230 [Iris pallida]|uniref:Uncharacterized protein n=1 Tax=Iris pallida TaxID=29817 RepID=A0AAX6FVN6_IRIPA|nr:hypothetical protein M6B38_398230 [Iris pallida]